ncbi:MAG: ABC transporter ATP-binding protein [Deltaproteobacteria bacterium]|nr:ABC transporter ATP-binding protein [Deltaproteobacteria bacterium]
MPSPGRAEPLLVVRDLRKMFPVAGRFVTVLDGLRFHAKEGELICILGRSGCGKSTLLKILAGFLAPSAGQVLLEGRPVDGPSPERCVVFQEDALFTWLTVGENIGFGLRVKGLDRTSRERAVERYLSLIGLTEFRDYLPQAISGGMKQRVSLARVLILEPRVLLMDEPFASLDAQTREEMQSLLLSLRRRLSQTILFVTHDVNEAATLADRILLMGKEPGWIRKDIAVTLPRPRAREDPAYIDLCSRLHRLVRD